MISVIVTEVILVFQVFFIICLFLSCSESTCSYPKSKNGKSVGVEAEKEKFFFMSTQITTRLWCGWWKQIDVTQYFSFVTPI